MRAAPGLAEETRGVRVVDHRERIVFFGEIANRGQIRDRPIHRKAAVGSDQPETRILRGTQLCF